MKNLLKTKKIYLYLILNVFFFLLSQNSFPFGQKRHTLSPPPPPPEKKQVLLLPFPDTWIELPQKRWNSFGHALYAWVQTSLIQSNDFSILIPSGTKIRSKKLSFFKNRYTWNASQTPSVKLKMIPLEVSFTIGSRGNKIFYGFNHFFKTPFNNGRKFLNEFPSPRTDGSTSFGTIFKPLGTPPFDTHSGLDLEQGVLFNAIFAFLKLKYTSYQAHLKIKTILSSPLLHWKKITIFNAHATGWTFDFLAGFDQWEVGFSFLKGAVFYRASKKLFKKIMSSITPLLKKPPHIAKIDHILNIRNKNHFLLGTGKNTHIPIGTRFFLLNSPHTVFQIIHSHPSGSEAKLISSDSPHIQIGDLVIEDTAFSRKQLHLGSKKSFFKTNLLSYSNSSTKKIKLYKNIFPIRPSQHQFFSAWIQSLLKIVFLPYRIWRYLHTDRIYKKHPDAGWIHSPTEWSALSLKKAWWKKEVFEVDPLSSSDPLPLRKPKVAILDTGVDYNHPAIHLAFEPDHLGWDFISNDSRPYDDHYRGTELASLILTLAPHAKLIAYKIFHPWGWTRSAAIFAAFQKALKAKVDLILIGWDTYIASKALALGLQLAQKAGIPVITSAGEGSQNITFSPHYPASWAPYFSNLLVVTAAKKNHLVKTSNFSPQRVHLAAPGENLFVAHPRGQFRKAHGSAYAAALVAGALARKLTLFPKLTPTEAQKALLKDAISVPALKAWVQKGLFLHIRKLLPPPPELPQKNSHHLITSLLNPPKDVPQRSVKLA